MADITLSERAARRISAIVAKEGGDKALRVAVIGGGCSGFQYTFALDAVRTADDLVLERDGASVFIDAVFRPSPGGIRNRLRRRSDRSVLPD